MRSQRRTAARVLAAVVPVALLLGVWAGIAPADGSAEPTTVADLERTFDVGSIPSEFVVVIDTSGSMGEGPDPLYPKVQAFAGLVDQLPNGSRLAVVTFDSVPTTLFEGNLDPSNREQAKTLPSKLGDATDIGAALNNSVDRLDHPGAPEIQTVIFLTDGRPEPPAGSAYTEVGNDAWKQTKAHAAAVEQRRPVAVRALGIGDAGKEGAELANQVYSRTEVVQLSGSQLGDYLTNEVAKARQRALAKAIQNQISAGQVEVKASPPSDLTGEVTVPVTLRSTLPDLGVDVDLERVSAVDFQGNPVRSSIVGGSRVVHLPPKGEASFEVVVKPDVESTALFEVPPPKREEVDVQLDFQQSAKATPTALLQNEFGVDPTVRVASTDPFTLGRTVGKTWSRFFLELLLLLLVLVLASYVYWRFIRRPRLVGELVLDGYAAELHEPVRLHGKSMKLESTDLGGSGRTRFRVFTKRGHRRQVFVERLGIEGALERKSGNRWAPVESGSKVGLGLYRVDAEGGTRFRWRQGDESE